MPDTVKQTYKSKHTGQQVDNAVDMVVSLNETIPQTYVAKTDINISIAGLVDGKVPTTQLPLATPSSVGVISIGSGLTADSEGVLQVDADLYYNKSEIDGMLTKKLDSSEKAESLSDLRNDLITVEVHDQNNPSVYHLRIKDNN